MWHHLQKASKEFFANRWILQDPYVSIATRLKYFDRMMTTVACFAAGHRVEKKGGWTRTCLTWNYAVVGNPPGTNWLDWHEIFTRWNERAGHFAAVAGAKSETWSSHEKAFVKWCLECWCLVVVVFPCPSRTVALTRTGIVCVCGRCQILVAMCVHIIGGLQGMRRIPFTQMA